MPLPKKSVKKVVCETEVEIHATNGADIVLVSHITSALSEDDSVTCLSHV